MSKKKNDDDKLRHSPFDRLKGLSVSAAARPPANAGKPPASPPESGEEEEPDFEREMSRLGVNRTASARNPKVESEKALKKPEPVSRPLSEEELFLQSIGRLDSVFRDEFQEELPSENTVRASARRVKQLRQGRITPEDEIDLHGLTREQARARVRYFLDNAVYLGKKTVLVVTGKGMGSTEGEPVLRGEMEDFMSGEGRPWVAEWIRAPRQYGGEGALIVFLRQAKGQQ